MALFGHLFGIRDLLPRMGGSSHAKGGACGRPIHQIWYRNLQAPEEILSRYMDHARRFDQAAARRTPGRGEFIPFQAPLKELEQEPSAAGDRSPPAHLGRPREPRDRQDALPLRRDGRRATSVTCWPSFRPAPEPTQSRSGSGVGSSASRAGSPNGKRPLRGPVSWTALSPPRLPFAENRGGPPTLALGVFQKLVDIPLQRDDLRLWKTEATYELPNRTAARQREAQHGARSLRI